jgi:hypothetical protein
MTRQSLADPLSALPAAPDPESVLDRAAGCDTEETRKRRGLKAAAGREPSRGEAQVELDSSPASTFSTKLSDRRSPWVHGCLPSSRHRQLLPTTDLLVGVRP